MELREKLIKLLENNDNLIIDKFISDNLKFIVTKNQSDELLSCMDIILKNTNDNNTWFYNLKFLKIKKFYDTFLNNFDYLNFDNINLINVLNSFCMVIPFNEVYSNKLIDKLVTSKYSDIHHMYQLLLSVDKSLALKYISYYLTNNDNIDDIVKILISTNQKEFIINNIDLIFKKIKNFFLLKNVSYLKEKVNLFFDLHFDDVIDRLIDASDDIKRKIFVIFNETKDKEKINFHDINLIGSGNYSTVYEVGNKVIKIGYKRANQVHIDDENVLKPILYKIFGDEKRVFVEVQEKVKTFLDDELSDEELYSLYKKMRDNKKVWVDIKRSNVGIYNGNLVVIDGDHIYDENDDNRFNKVKNKLFDSFEERYIGEKKRVKK